MTHREYYYFSKAKHKYYAKKRKHKKDEKVCMLPNLRKLTQSEQKPNTVGYTGIVGGGVR